MESLKGSSALIAMNIGSSVLNILNHNNSIYLYEWMFLFIKWVLVNKIQNPLFTD